MSVQADAPAGGPPPWLDDTIQQQFGWRDGNIVVAVPPKSGTTWTMNIVHQLRSGGDASFADIYAEVPWLEFVPTPESAVGDMVARFDAMPSEPRRAFKTHAAPPTLPVQGSGSGTEVRYLVVARHPDEAIASFRPFLDRHSDAWYERWQVDKNDIVAPDLHSYIAGCVSHAR
jgi:aryl sulfotransferase